MVNKQLFPGSACSTAEIPQPRRNPPVVLTTLSFILASDLYYLHNLVHVKACKKKVSKYNSVSYRLYIVVWQKNKIKKSQKE